MIAIKGLIMTELDTRTAVSKYLPIPKGKLPYHWRGPRKVDQKYSSQWLLFQNMQDIPLSLFSESFIMCEP